MEHFIETVRKYPCLWNTTAIEYRDQELKDAAWTEVMKESDLSSVKEVKLKWKKLRDSYRDALRRQSVSGARATIPWKYQTQMAFLQPHMGARRKPDPPPPRPSPPSPPSPHDDDDSSESDASPAPSPPPAAAAPPQLKRPRLDAYSPDPLDIFFNSMCQAAKRLPYAAQLKIKRTLFEAVCEAEETLLAEQQTLASLWAARANSSSDDADDKPS